MFPIDLLADLPAPRDDEPPSLRDDIADELGDHLHCAFNRELLTGHDETTAEQRVLDRFGDPRRLARRLWRQAMWSRIMGRKLLLGLQWVLTFAAVGLAGAVCWQQSVILTEMNAQQTAESHWRQNLAMTLNDLRGRLPPQTAGAGGGSGMMDAGGSAAGSMSSGGGMGMPMAPAGAGPMGAMPGGMGAAGGGGLVTPSTPQPPPELIVKLVQETEDGPPVRDVKQIYLQGTTEIYTAEPEHQLGPASPGGAPAAGLGGIPAMPGGFAPNTPGTGRYFFSSVEPDRYVLQIQLTDSQHTTQQVLIRENQPQEITVVCPGPRKKASVLITVPPLPDDFREAGFALQCHFEEEALHLGGNEWLLSSPRTLRTTFDPVTGLVRSFVTNSNSADLKDARAEDRALFLASGPVKFRYEFVKLTPVPGSYPVIQWPADYDQRPTRVMKPGENRWELELPEELLDQARTAPASVYPAAATAAPAAVAPTRRRGPAAAAEPLGERCRLTVKLTSETKDGPAPEDAVVRLLDERGNGAIVHQNGQQIMVSQTDLDADGVCVMGPFEPGRYTLTVGFPDGRHLKEKLPLLRPGQERTEHVVCPPPLKKSTVAITLPLPKEFQRPDLEFSTRIDSVPTKLDGRLWHSNTDFESQLKFDKTSGLLIQQGRSDLTKEPPEDRVLFLSSGPYRLVTQITRNKVLLEFGDVYHRSSPPDTKEERDQPTHIAEPGDNTWEIKPPEEFWDTVRKKLAEPE